MRQYPSLNARNAVDRAAGADFPRLARRLFGNVRLDFSDTGSRESRLVSAMLGPCRLSRLSADRHMVHGERVTEGDAPDMIKLIIQTEGNSVLHQSGRRLPVGPSSMVLYDPVNPYVLSNPEAVDLLMLQVPRKVLSGMVSGGIRRPLATVLIPGSLHRVLYSMMQSIILEIETLEDGERAKFGQTMLELVAGMVSGTVEAETAPRSLKLLRERIKDYIASNLGRPELGAPEIARKVGCSLRYVYSAFESEDTTPGDYIWSERLRSARDLLASRPFAPGVIGDIAFSLGFSSSAHFSRAFRNRFNQTPREWARTTNSHARGSGL